MSINNFKELERMEISKLGNPPEIVKKNIVHNMNVFRFIGDLVELYLPNFGRSLMKMTGANSKDPKSPYPNQN